MVNGNTTVAVAAVMVGVCLFLLNSLQNFTFQNYHFAQCGLAGASNLANHWLTDIDQSRHLNAALF